MSKYDIPEAYEQNNGGAKFIVIGVGGGGGNAVEHMVKQNIAGVTFAVTNTDIRALDNLTVPNKFQLGVEGLGVGGDPNLGREYAEGYIDEIRALLSGYNMVFITAGMGGGTGTGAAPVVARVAKEMGILTVAVVTTPFSFEGGGRMKVAKQGIAELLEYVDSIITVPNEKLLEVYSNIDIEEAFGKADDVLSYAVQGIIEVESRPGRINVDFKDVEKAVRSGGYAMMGIGRANGENRVQQAVERAIKSPLLDNLKLENAKGIIINVKGKQGNIKLNDFNEVQKQLGKLANITDEGGSDKMFWGLVYDDSLDDDIQVTIIATGLEIETAASSRLAQAQPSIVNHGAYSQPVVTPQPNPSIKSGSNRLDMNDFLRNEFRN